MREVSRSTTIAQKDARARKWDMAVQVRRTTAELLPGGYPAIDDTAQVLDVSVRTLQRRLAELGLTYSAVVDEVRLCEAQRWLGKTDVKLGDISAKLGFKDAGSFSRAFKRWTGVEPRSFRKSQSILLRRKGQTPRVRRARTTT